MRPFHFLTTLIDISTSKVSRFQEIYQFLFHHRQLYDQEFHHKKEEHGQNDYF